MKISKLTYIFSLNFFLFNVFQAQTGPAGVGTSATNVLWLSADNAVYNNAGTTLAGTTDNVQQWNDRSGNTKNATQAVVANRPNYITSVVNGLPVIRYSAGNDNLMSTAVGTANIASVWAVAAYASLPSSNPGILVAAPAGSGTNVATGSKVIGMWVSNAAGTQVWGRGVQSNGTTRDISQTTTLNGSTFYIINNIYRSATSINQFVNNAAAGNNTSHNGTLSSWEEVTIGRQGTESWNGDIAEVIFYNTEVNSAEKIIVDNYLAAKYGLTLSSNDLYNKDNAGNGNYDFEVAGIGQVDASNSHNSAQGSGIVRILNPGGLGNNEFLFWGHDNASLQATNVTDVPAGVQARMARVWRVSEVSGASAAVSVGSIDIRFDLAGLGSVTASDLRLLVDTDNDGVFTNETGISGASLVSGTIYQFTGVTAITNDVRFSLGTINKSQTPLPIELLSFTAELVDNSSVELKWSTATEKNNSYFEMQRTIDGINWEVIATVAGSGNSSVQKKYSVIDAYPYNLKSYYRVTQVDLDERKTHSPIVMIDLEGKLNYELEIYPNPTSGNLVVQGNQSEFESLQIFDVVGRTMDLNSIKSNINPYKFVLDLSGWQAGVYFLRTKTQVRKIVRS